MRNIWRAFLGITMLAFFLFSCVTTKKKGEETSKFKRNYHSFTNKYNYWFNADELYRQSIAQLEESHKDNYNQILDVYPYASADPQSVRNDMDNVIQKASKGIVRHRPGRWVDDNYLLIGQAQFIKRDFETAEQTFRFIKEQQDPRHQVKSKVKSTAEKKKLSREKAEDRKKAAKEKAKAREKAAKEKAKARKKAAREKEKAKKEAARYRKKYGHSKPKSDTTNKNTGTPAVATTPPPPPAEQAPKPAKPAANPYAEPWGRYNAFPNSMIWYGRTLTERENYDEAEFHFRSLWEDPDLPKNLYDDLATAEANLFIKEKEYDKAIEPLKKAIDLTRNKRQRARLSFILAQLYDRSDKYEQAYASYDLVLKSNPKYEMAFNARLQQTYAGWANGKLTSEDVGKVLDKMLKDAKNLEYRDQIYYTLATIALHDGNRKEAIANLRKSLVFNQNNAPQRAESYLKLADLYFEAEDFVSAKNYYDSTLTVLPATDPRFKRATDYANNLKDIARLIQTIAANDSIVRIYHMTPDERKEFGKKLKKQQEEEDAAKAASAKPVSAADAVKSLTPQAGQRPSSFYFYNEAFLKKGKKDFSKLWGDRKLEDNWRRSNRVVTGVEALAGIDTSSQVENREDAGLNDLFANIPKSEAELSVIHLATYEAMFQLGTLFRDKLQNNKRCVGTLEEMQTRYPDTARYEKETWYYCYLAHTDLGNADRAKYYLEKLKDKYPNSAFARVLTDPDFLNATKEREHELNKYYEDTYALFQNGGYKDAYDRCQEAPKKFGSQNPLTPKFALLSALCVGNLNGNDAYCAALGEVIGRYPNSQEATRAKEIARVLSCKGFETDDKKKNSPLAIDDAFTRDDDKLHYFIVALKGDNVRLDEVKAAISDYNRENHRLEQLRISNIFLGTDTGTPIVVIRKFDNKEQAMRYYEEVKNRKDFLGETAKKSYNKEFFAITQENYRRILKNKTLDGYREFFAENYVKK